MNNGPIRTPPISFRPSPSDIIQSVTQRAAKSSQNICEGSGFSLSKTYTASSGFSTNSWAPIYCAGSSPVHENIIVDLVIRALTRTSQIFFNASKVKSIWPVNLIST